MLNIHSIRKQSFAVGATASMVAILLLVMMTLVGFILIKGTDYFWPKPLYELEFVKGTVTKQVFVSITRSPKPVQESDKIWLFNRGGNWTRSVLEVHQDQVLTLVKRENIAQIVMEDGQRVYGNFATSQHKQSSLNDQLSLVKEIQSKVNHLKRSKLSSINIQLSSLNDTGSLERQSLLEQYQDINNEIAKLNAEIAQFTHPLIRADGTSMSLNLGQVATISFPNQLHWFGKLWASIKNAFEFLFSSPKQSNTAGGIFPALFGTILMVLLMTLMVTPMGVITALYLYEYAPDNWLTSFIRIFVNNLAGVPSIVYGVFGLGFFVYFIGGNIDELLFEDNLPSPTFGSPGLIWASLTMAILTLPVVIVSTEEGLRRVPQGLRLGSYALGATKYETIIRTVLPIASPGIMTGVILAIARAAGEVAPLMLVGAVKFAPALPIDGEFPYFHGDRQFMHLGVMVFDGAFHNSHLGQGSEFMFAACLVLLSIVVILNIGAIMLRGRLRTHYNFMDR